MKAEKYFGPISAEGIVETECSGEREKGIVEVLELIRRKAEALGANSVVGFTMTLDPFGVTPEGYSALYIRADGTAGLLRPFL